MEINVVNSSKIKWIVALALVLLLAAISLGLVWAQPQENVITVGSSIDGDTLFTEDIKQNNDGRCTLREAIIAANTDGKSGGKPGECEAGNGADIIELPPGYVYTLSRTDNGNEDSSQTGDLDIDSDITIRPAGPGGLVVIQGNGGFSDRILHVLESGDLTLSDVTIRGGNEKDIGGGIYNQNNLELTNVTLTDNSAVNSGGALYNDGSATLHYVTIKGNNAASGDGLANGSGLLSLNYSYIEGDSCSGLISVAAGVENLAPIGSGCAASHGEGPGLSLLAYDFDGDGAADYYRLPEGSSAVNIATAETSCAYASPDPLGMERPQGATCDLGANEVEHVNQPPFAVDDPGVVTTEDTAVDIHVAANDSDPDGNLDPSTVTVISGPAFGEAQPTVGQPGTIIYVPDADYNGADSFEYKIFDSEGLWDTAVVSIQVNPDSYIEVTQSGDSGPGSLRAAIMIANEQTVPGTIIFEIGPDPCAPETISVEQALPVIDQQVTIDGLMQENGAACPAAHITLDGGGGLSNGLTIASGVSGAVVREITIQNFGLDGVALLGSGTPAAGSIIQNTSILSNGRNGVSIGDAASAGDGNSLLDNTIANNCGSGVLIFGLGASSGFDPGEINGNLMQGNTIADNGTCGLTVDGTPGGMSLDDGITIADGWNNQILDNNIYGSPDLNVDLGGDGPTENDIDDPDNGANYEQNYPWLLNATPTGGINGGKIGGYFNSVANNDFTFQFFLTDSCDDTSSASTPLNISPPQFSTDADGNTIFSTTVLAPDSLSYGQYVISTATENLMGNTSEYSNCIEVDDDNTVWTDSWVIESGDIVNQKLISLGQSRWYKFWVTPNSRLRLTLEDLPANYDLVYFGNIGEAYAELIGNTNPDLNRMDSEFSTDAFAPATLNPATLNPATLNPATLNPATLNPATLNPATLNPATLNNALFSADVYSPATLNPATLNPATLNQALFNPATLNPATLNGNAYSAAQMSSLIAASGEDGNAPEEIAINSYNSSGWFYARVRGRSGAYDRSESGAFTLKLEIDSTICNGISEDFGNPPPVAVAGNFETIILVDWNRMGLGDPAGADRAAVEGKLNQLAALGSVNGVVVDVGANQEVYDRNLQADTFYTACPYAKNVVAEGIKQIVDAYWQANPEMKYVVIVGDDETIPFWRIPDQALLGPEQDYVVPVDPDSASEASLRNNYFLSQDPYGSLVGIDVKNEPFPIPDLGIGRVLETPAEIINIVDAYIANPVMVPQNSLVTAYDFLTDGGEDVRDVLTGVEGGATGLPVNDDLLVANPDSWTAYELDDILDTQDFDLAYLSGHFSANVALAADYETNYLTTDFVASPQDFTGALFYSGGCHAGYNIVNEHGIPFYTLEPDWPAAMAQKGATLIAGTGYQYGDTDFVEYSERLYLEFTRQLRTDAVTNVAIGDALAKAKLQYLIDTPSLRGIHQKALLEATIFGLPMSSVNMPGPRLDLSSGSNAVVGAPVPFEDPAIAGDPGELFGLEYYDLVRNYNLTEVNKSFNSVEDPDGPSFNVSYLENGPDGYVNNAGEPVLPLDIVDASVSNRVLRGVGFLGGSYRDFAERIPLVGAATTEVSVVHFDFLSFVFYLQQPWSINRFDVLSSDDGETRLNIFPGQYKTVENLLPDERRTATQRRYDQMSLRLFYMPQNFLNGIDIGVNRPDLAAAPTIITVQGNPLNGDVEFVAKVVGDPSAGIQDVWITHTTASTPSQAGNSGTWQSLSLDQDPADPTLWRGTQPGIGTPQNMRYIVQAVSGTGLVTMSNNMGRFYIPGVTEIPVTLSETSGPSPRSGQVGTTAAFTADLDVEGGTGNEDLSGLPIIFSIGEDLRLSWTDAAGTATAEISLLSSLPGEQPVTITFPGTAVYTATAAETLPFIVEQADTSLVLDPLAPDEVSVESVLDDVPLFATLKDGQGRPLAEKTVTFTLTNGGPTIQKAVITNQAGTARLGQVENLSETEYTITARFDGSGSYKATTAPGYSTLIFNRPPLCQNVFVETFNGKATIWPPTSSQMIGLTLDGASDPDGDDLTYYFTSIFQDEDPGTEADGTIAAGCSEAEARAERDGGGDGRVYHVSFLVDDGKGGTCTGVTRIAVTHDQSEIDAIDGGPLFNSLGEGAFCTP